jgi:hypothetical protein
MFPSKTQFLEAIHACSSLKNASKPDARIVSNQNTCDCMLAIATPIAFHDFGRKG